MSHNTAIAEQRTHWEANITSFNKKYELPENTTKTDLTNELTQLFTIAEQISHNTWTPTDDTCPHCDAEHIFYYAITPEVARHENNETAFVNGINERYDIAYECTECNTPLLVSPPAIVNSEVQHIITKNTDTELHNNDNDESESIAPILTTIAEQHTTEWKPGTHCPHTNTPFIREEQLEVYPAKLDSGIAHINTLGELLQTTTYRCDRCGDSLLQTATGATVNDFALK